MSHLHKCDNCEEFTANKCTGCMKKWYCSRRCQEESWVLHIFECNPNRKIPTSYHLARAVMNNVIPDNLQACKDFGFTQAFLPENRSKLLGLYNGLIVHLKVTPKTISQWQKNGTLIQGIKEAYDQLPEDGRGYYPWFLENLDLLGFESNTDAKRDPIHESFMRAWEYIGGQGEPTTEEISARVGNFSKEKQLCFQFCQGVLSQWHPSPDMSTWIPFGFCCCVEDWQEKTLGGAYNFLIQLSTFDEILAAMNTGGLGGLFKAKGIQLDSLNIPHLIPHISGDESSKYSVWHLKQFVQAHNWILSAPVLVDYGFINCRNEEERKELKAVYAEYFQNSGAGAIDLHMACINGRIFPHIEKFVTLKRRSQERMRRLMINLYPLQV